MWRLAFALGRGQLRYLMVQLRTTTFPVWRCRLALATYPLKISWRGAETDTFYAAYSWALACFRVKVLRIQSLGGSSGDHWTFKYGLKYDGRARFGGGGALWTVLCQIQSPHGSLRLPIGILLGKQSSSSSVVTGVGSLLLAEFAEQHLLAPYMVVVLVSFL